MSEEEKIHVINIPSMVYYGVNSREAVLMRSTNVPRSIATEMGSMYKQSNNLNEASSTSAVNWISNLKDEEWNKVSEGKKFSGEEYREI
ncbi:hypothetical protein LF817_13600 [Halobacillus sp. A1]|uniref:hypothetical protein n=1 Tax=Halobacillus sp. A1 TaxID=2880262 RepID=UPI0020A65705|nr:hypothetical protein [Halobacillus sp. A1]MCP3032375.1 hypothetical protein [Halobacillus sp. A1]